MRSFFIIVILLTISSLRGEILPWTDEDLEKLEAGEIVVGFGLLTGSEDIDETITFDSLTEEEKEEIESPLIARPIPVDPNLREIPPVDDSRELISTRLAKRYFDQQIEQGILDPQNLLTNKERLDLKYALERHAEKSPVSIYFYLFDSNQKISSEYSTHTVFNTHYYSEPSAVVVYYFIEEPERSQIFFGGKDSNLVAKSKIRDLESSIKLGAKQRSNKIGQLDEFIRRLSLQMYWIEQSMITGNYELPVEYENSKSSSSSLSNPVTTKVYEGLSTFSKYWWMVALASISLIGILLAGAYWVANRKFLFPPLNIPSRLNLPNGGSSGGVLGYSNEKLPPSAQREQFDEPF